MVSKIIMNKAKYEFPKLEVNMVRLSDITMHGERCNLGNLSQEKSSLLNSGRFSQNTRAVAVNDAQQNIIIMLKNLKEKFTAAIGIKADTPETLEFVLGNTILDMRSRMKKSYDELLAFITGGVHYDGNKNGKKSVELFDVIYNTLVTGERIPTTILAEQKIDMYDKAAKGINFYSVRDKANIYDGLINDIKGVKADSSVEVEEAANRIFDFVEISDRVPVKIIDKDPYAQI